MKAKQPVVGGACVVTSGPNKGKRGKYTRDENGKLWCEGDWGGTQCATSKCRPGVAQIGFYEYTDDDGTLVHESEGLIEIEGLGLFDVTVQIEAESGTTRFVSAVPLTGTRIADLRDSESEEERALAAAVTASVMETKMETKQGK